jgi:Mg2+ and Co2+ transporter CorA
MEQIMLFSEFINLTEDEKIELTESLLMRIKHHVSNAERMKQKLMRKKSSYKLKQKILAKLRKRKHCPTGQVVDYDGKGCHKPKHLTGIKRKEY